MPKLLETYGAHGYQFGRKHSGGRWRQQPAITFFTKRKHDPASGAEIARIPTWLTWTDGKRRHRLRTDVIELADALELQAGVFGPGDGMQFGAQVASIGAAVNRPGAAALLTTAGHTFGHRQNEGQTVTISSGAETAQAKVEISIVQGSIDYALLSPIDAVQCDNLFNDQIRIGPLFHPTLGDVDTPLMVLDRFGRATPTQCRGVDATIESRGVTYDGLITTDPVTVPGQSGGALIDYTNRLWGFVIGRIGPTVSIFVPAHVVFTDAGVLLT